ncbi:MAG TPA: UDP-N-acetylmuramate dehydrogenase [Desulfurivibrionaceae bacterium]|nr:UDP-N-acetylmuramate dehydrogenase [Desulfurivibrionaceae bacterium]
MVISDRQLRELLGRCWAGPVAWDEPLAKWSSLRVGGPARALVQPGSIEAVRRLIMACMEVGLPWLVIGGGTNLLVGDAGFPGLVLVVGRNFSGISECGFDRDGRTLVKVEAGCALARLLGWSLRRGLSGLEFSVGIPGSVGGAVVMNAGAWGREIKDVLAGLHLLLPGGEVDYRERRALDFSYRRWSGPAGVLVLSATFALSSGDPAVIKAVCREHLQARKNKQPRGVASAGSFFKNPDGDFAGRLIEAAGLKGLTVGGARVSEIHANFLVNSGGATATEMLALMRLVQEKVMSRFGVWLEPEVRIITEACLVVGS